ncbi:MAG: hypothetical protein WBP79_07235, partial [Candidatus Acidiferrales bacterium]
LYCLACFEKDRIWVTFDDSREARQAARSLSKALHKKMGNVTGVFTGTFLSGEQGYGHMGFYRHEIVLHSARDLKVVEPQDHLGLGPGALDPNSRAKVCQ